VSAPHVLIVTQQFLGTRSGTGLYARLLALELSRRGRPLTVATWSREIDPEALPSARWIDLGEPPRWDPTPGSFVALGRRLAAAVGRGPANFALVHFTDAREAHGFLRALPAGVERPPLVGTVHDDYAAAAPRGPLGFMGRAADPLRRWAYYAWLRRVERRAYPRFARLMVNSDATGKSVAAHYGLDPARFDIVPLCAAPPADLPADVEPLEGEPALLFAGGNFYRKGLDVLVRALAILLETAPGARLHVAGEDAARARISRLADACGASDAVTFHGRVPRDRMAGMMAGADTFVMPSRTEALGLVYLEAMRARTPAVSGNVGGVTEIVRDGDSGLTVPPEDPPALAAALLRLHRDADLRERVVSGGLAVAAARTPERLADATAAVYDSIA